MNKKWQYLLIRLSEAEDRDVRLKQDQETLARLGKEGWELVSVTPKTGWETVGTASYAKAYFKREL